MQVGVLQVHKRTLRVILIEKPFINLHSAIDLHICHYHPSFHGHNIWLFTILLWSKFISLHRQQSLQVHWKPFTSAARNAVKQQLLYFVLQNIINTKKCFCFSLRTSLFTLFHVIGPMIIELCAYEFSYLFDMRSIALKVKNSSLAFCYFFLLVQFMMP